MSQHKQSKQWREQNPAAAAAATDTSAAVTATTTSPALPPEAAEANAALASSPPTDAAAPAVADGSPGFVVYNGPYVEPKWDTDLGPSIRMAAVCAGVLLFLMCLFAGIIWWLESGTGAA
jgi:hypothetical protein